MMSLGVSQEADMVPLLRGEGVRRPFSPTWEGSVEDGWDFTKKKKKK